MKHTTNDTTLPDQSGSRAASTAYIPLRFERAALVYQAGIANVFSVDAFCSPENGRNAKRLTQSDFRSCAWFACGLKVAGVKVLTYACNEAGDIKDSQWTTNLDEQPFSDQFIIVRSDENEDEQ